MRTGLDTLLARLGLVPLAAFHPVPELRPDPECRTLVLVGPDGKRFWPVFNSASEYRDGLPDPLDRWTRRTLTPLAAGMSARAYFPFGGPPHQPFVAWALASGQVWQSPVHLLVHARSGLQVSFRAALAFDAELELPDAPQASPCATCIGQPCRNACPVAALSSHGYDVPRCHAFLDTAPGLDCMGNGCRVRRACPVGTDQHDPARAAFHMEAFQPTANQFSVDKSDRDKARP